MDLKTVYLELKEKIQILKKENGLLDLGSILRNFPPCDNMYETTQYESSKKQNREYLSNKKKIIDFYNNEEWDKKNDKEKFERFKIFCEMYHISYFKSRFKDRTYITILNEVKPIREEFSKKGFHFSNIYERAILDPKSSNINLSC